jgi:hypothetical protein
MRKRVGGGAALLLRMCVRTQGGAACQHNWSHPARSSWVLLMVLKRQLTCCRTCCSSLVTVLKDAADPPPS